MARQKIPIARLDQVNQPRLREPKEPILPGLRAKRDADIDQRRVQSGSARCDGLLIIVMADLQIARGIQADRTAPLRLDLKRQ